MKRPLRRKLLLAIGTPILVAFAGLLIVNHLETRALAMGRMEDRLAELTLHEAAVHDGQFALVALAARTAARMVAQDPSADHRRISEILTSSLDANPRIRGVGIGFEPGPSGTPGSETTGPSNGKAPYLFRAQDGKYVERDFAGRDPPYTVADWYLIARTLRQPGWTEPFYDAEGGGRLVATYSAPIETATRAALANDLVKDGVVGVARADISLDDLHDRVAKTRLEGGYCAIVSQEGTFLSHPNRDLIMRWSIFALAEWHSSAEWEELGRKMVAGESGIESVRDLGAGAPVLVVYAPIPSAGWSFVAVIPRALVMAPVYRALWTETGLTLGALLLILIGLVISSIQITRPIEHLSAAVQKVAAGDLSARAEGIPPGDEIGEFANTFNRMVDDLREHVRALTAETALREAIEGELRAARRIQSSLLPRIFPPFPHRKEFDLHAINAPAKHVAGDFFDFFTLPDDTLVVLIADVSGKGVPAALFMAVTRTLIRSVEAEGIGPAEVLARVNRVLTETNDQDMFVTLFLTHYSPKTGLLRYANAGHNLPYVISPDGKVRPLDGPRSPMLGVFDPWSASDSQTTLAVGETLVLFTDGVPDAQPPAGEMFGDERFERLLAQHAGDSLPEICQVVTSTLEDFQQHARHDDVTLLLLRRQM